MDDPRDILPLLAAKGLRAAASGSTKDKYDSDLTYDSLCNDFARKSSHGSPYAMHEAMASEETLTGACSAPQRQLPHRGRSDHGGPTKEAREMSLTNSRKAGHVGAATSRTNTIPDQKPPKRKLHQVETNFRDRSYMSRSSPFSLDSPQAMEKDEPTNDMSFLEWYPKGNATITYPSDNGRPVALSGLHPYIIEERSALIAQAFESSREGQQLHLDCLDSGTALPLVRYLYTGSYAPAGNHYEDVPTSLLLHCKMYRLGDLYDLPDLKQQAQVNVIRQCEFGCSSPSVPIDLCMAVEYAYEFLRKHTGLIENIICYCVTCFLRHRLAKRQDFQSLAYKLRPFHQDLCKEAMKRDADEADTAAAIIQMPFEPYAPPPYASREDLPRNRLEDVVYHFHGAEDDGELSKRRRTEDYKEPSLATLPVRVKQQMKQENAVEDKSEADAISLALRGKKPKGKSPIRPDNSSIKDRRTSPTAPEQLKPFENEHPVLAKVRQFVDERRARNQDKEPVVSAGSACAACGASSQIGVFLSPADTQLLCSSCGSPRLPKYGAAASSSRSSSRTVDAVQDYDMQCRLLEERALQVQRVLKKQREEEASRVKEQKDSSEAKIERNEAVKIKPGEEGPAEMSDIPEAENPFVDPLESDSEYEVVAGPAAVEELSSSDSEIDGEAVIVDLPTPDQGPRSRTMSIASSDTLVTPRAPASAGESSDSEWDLV